MCIRDRPRGGVIEIEGREHSITEVNFKSRTVILKDLSLIHI